ncbi:cell division regulator GpsB [Lacticigenium naphthae]|uniref:cell division regulator GpsB n=1 Tax=Lacticigenium naphthae TaxID=515351 RepID=UPI000426C037|nr:cell division regulator GpsB [Lacticigenium naphthae]
MNNELMPKEILEKEFKTSMRGYNQTEVDEFLDVVIRDYEAFQSEINNLRSENDRLVNKLDETSRGGSSSVSGGGSTTTVTNFDILKRLSNLERHVFGSKLDD